ncbi:MAG: acyl-CoA desaturase [Zetaproteobacteria bacterium]|nr:acyl-CoA desaturase [Pseudobdellovibrionaceae bacterium]
MARTKNVKLIRTIGLTINFGLTLAAIVGLYLEGVSWFAFGFWAVAAYFCMLTHETFYHRYFSHKSFKTGRKTQFVMGLLAELAPVRGPVFWAALHRDHHRYTDKERDPHSPSSGIWNSYMGWVYQEENIAHNYKNCADLTRYPELLVIDRLFWLPMVLSFIAIYWLGAYLATAAPALGTSGFQLLVWGGFLRVLYVVHIFAMLNLLSHLSVILPKYKQGYRNFDSPDSSRNLWWLAIFGAGVGWHNNHHRYGVYATSKVMWWEIDTTAWVIYLLEKMGLIWAVKWPPPKHIEEAKAERKRQKELRQLQRRARKNNVKDEIEAPLGGSNKEAA